MLEAALSAAERVERTALVVQRKWERLERIAFWVAVAATTFWVVQSLRKRP